MTFGQPYVGTDDTPSLLRKSGLRSMLTQLGWRVQDKPDLDHSAENLLHLYRKTHPGISVVPEHPDAKNSVLVGAGTQLLSNVVKDTCKAGQFPLVLGGDHSISLGSLTGVLQVRPDTGILWIDAHADLHTPSTSETGKFQLCIFSGSYCFKF